TRPPAPVGAPRRHRRRAAPRERSRRRRGRRAPLRPAGPVRGVPPRGRASRRRGARPLRRGGRQRRGETMSGQRRVLGGWGQVGLVAGREIRERVRARSFQVSTGLLVLVIVALGVIVRVGVGDGPGALRVAVVDADGGALEQALVAAGERSDREVDPVSVPDGSTARRVVDDGDADLAVLAEDRQVLFADEVDEQALSIVRQAWAALDLRDALVGHGLEESEVAEALSARPIEATTLSGGDGDDGLAILVGTLAAILLFITLQTFGTYVLTGVVEE